MIIDTSALISLYIPEKLSEFVRRKIDEKINTVASHTFYFIDLIYYEFPNVIRKRVVRGGDLYSSRKRNTEERVRIRSA